MTAEIIHIDRYQPVTSNGHTTWYAIAGKKKIEMPSCYSDMYTDEYLAITERTVKYTELFDKAPSHHYIPLYTGSREEHD